MTRKFHFVIDFSATLVLPNYNMRIFRTFRAYYVHRENLLSPLTAY